MGNLFLIIPFAIWLFGWTNEMSTLWVPLVSWVSLLIASPFASWLKTEKLGSAANLSVMIKFILQLIQFVGVLAFWGSLGILISWAFEGQMQ